MSVEHYHVFGWRPLDYALSAYIYGDIDIEDYERILDHLLGIRLDPIPDRLRRYANHLLGIRLDPIPDRLRRYANGIPLNDYPSDTVPR